MQDFTFTGPGPVTDPALGLVRPGDVRGFTAEPDWGPWEPVEDPGADEGNLPSPPEASPAALSTAPALNITPAAPEGI